MRSSVRATLPVLLFCLLSLVACQSSHTQSRILISDPEDGPAVVQIRSADGEERSIAVGEDGSSGAVEESSPLQPAPAPARQTSASEVPAPARSPATSRHAYNSVNTDHPVIAITFDDGPHPTLTPRLLDILKQRNIPATFYVVGRNVAAHPDIVRRMVAEGHEVANHTWSHPSLTKIGAARVKSEMDQTTKAIRDAVGITPVTMRPPYGATNAALNRRMSEEFGMKVIMWSVDPQDWRYRNASRVSSHIIQNTKKGDIILAHDIHPSTVDAMPAALDALLAKGFRFVTVSELLKYDGAVRQTEPAAVASETVPEPVAEEETPVSHEL